MPRPNSDVELSLRRHFDQNPNAMHQLFWNDGNLPSGLFFQDLELVDTSRATSCWKPNDRATPVPMADNGHPQICHVL